MEDIVTLHLENEMDLLLANRRTMKLAELCGMSLTVQTALATAVSEIARTALSISKDSFLRLGITRESATKRWITAILCNVDEAFASSDAFRFAKRLVPNIMVINGTGGSIDIQMGLEIKYGNLITASKVASFVEYFKTEPPLSPYDEVSRKSIQLLEFSRKLEESESQYRKLADSLPLMMFAANPDGVVTYTNKWLRSCMGEGLATIAPSSIHPLTHPDDHQSLNKSWTDAFISGKPFSAEVRLQSKKGGEFLWHIISIHPVKNDLNVITQWTGFLVDVNAQKTVAAALKDNVELKLAKETLLNYQNQLERKISELNTSNSELEQFAHVASHDLQEPLRKIATFSTLLEGSLHNLDDLSRMYFHRIISSSVQMTDQIKDVLEWSAYAKHREPFSPVDLNSIVDRVKSDLEILIKQKRAEIRSSDLPVVDGSRLQLIRLFSNLVNNAMKFCNDEPVVTISSRVLNPKEAADKKNLDATMDYVEVAVTDNGIGFKQEYADRIFRIFQRLHGHHQYKGTGIGLAICKKIAENHRGEIYATSSPGKGTTFSVILPLTTVPIVATSASKV